MLSSNLVRISKTNPKLEHGQVLYVMKSPSHEWNGSELQCDLFQHERQDL